MCRKASSGCALRVTFTHIEKRKAPMIRYKGILPLTIMHGNGERDELGRGWSKLEQTGALRSTSPNKREKERKKDNECWK